MNIPGTYAHHFAADGAIVTVRVPGSRVPVKATVSRRANLNHTPRIVGGARLRDWFRTTTRIGDVIRVRVENNDRIEIVTVRPRTWATGRRPAEGAGPERSTGRQEDHDVTNDARLLKLQPRTGGGRPPVTEREEHRTGAQGLRSRPSHGANLDRAQFRQTPYANGERRIRASRRVDIQQDLGIQPAHFVDPLERKLVDQVASE